MGDPKNTTSYGFIICDLDIYGDGTGQLGEFMNIKGERYYDQFDYVEWINNG